MELAPAAMELRLPPAALPVRLNRCLPCRPTPPPSIAVHTGQGIFSEFNTVAPYLIDAVMPTGRTTLTPARDVVQQTARSTNISQHVGFVGHHFPIGLEQVFAHTLTC